jgi:hypothetical protein
MKTISKVELVGMFEAVVGNTFVGLDYTAPVEMKKTGNPYLMAGDEVTKTTSLTGQFGFDYEAGVNRQLVREGKEGSFEAQGRTWGENLGKGIILNPKNGEVSIQLSIPNAPSEIVYRVNGVVVDKAVLAPYLPAKSVNKSQGTDKEVVVRTYKVDRIKAVRMNGEEFLVV